MRKLRFRPHLGMTLAALAGVIATLALSHWQWQKAQQKFALAARFEQLAKEPPVRIGEQPVDAEQLRFRNVEAQGRWVADKMILLDNKIRHGIAGYEVVMPLAIGKGAMHVLINRGWIAGTGDRRQLPQVKTPTDPVTISGIAVTPPAHFLELSGDVVEGKVWQNLVLERYRKASGLAIQPVVIEQQSASDDGLAREWPAPDTGAARNQGYAFQWLSFAVMIAVLYVALNCKREAQPD